MASLIPFRPAGGENTVSITVGATTARVLMGGGEQIRVMNNGSATVWINFGDGTVVATAAGMPVAPGGTEVFTRPPGTTYASAIAAGATGIIYFTPGSGI